MQIAAIKKLLTLDVTQLEDAKQNLLNHHQLQIVVEGADAGEQMTHITAAIWIRYHMENHDSDASTALRAYTAMVRNAFN